MENIAVSVIIPVYNVEKYVCDCVDSILEQDLKDIEIILVDDASTDSTLGVIKKKYGDYDNIVVLEQESNFGPGYSRNRGLERAKGKYVYFMDGDDMLWAEDALSAMYKLAEEKEADIVHSTSYYVPENEDVHWGEEFYAHIERRNMEYEPETIREMGEKAFDRITRGYIAQKISLDVAWLDLYRRSFLLNEGIFFEVMPDLAYEDNLFVMTAYTATNRVWILPKTCYVYRQRESSVTHNRGLQEQGNLTLAIRTGLDHIIENAIRYNEVGCIKMMFSRYIFGIYEKLRQSCSNKDELIEKIRNAVDSAWYHRCGKLTLEDKSMYRILEFHFGKDKRFDRNE